MMLIMMLRMVLIVVLWMMWVWPMVGRGMHGWRGGIGSQTTGHGHGIRRFSGNSLFDFIFTPLRVRRVGMVGVRTRRSRMWHNTMIGMGHHIRITSGRTRSGCMRISSVVPIFLFIHAGTGTRTRTRAGARWSMGVSMSVSRSMSRSMSVMRWLVVM